MARYGSAALPPPQDMFVNAERLAPHPGGGAVAGPFSPLPMQGGHAHASLPPPPQHDQPSGRNREDDPRRELSRLLSSNLVASGTFAIGRKFDPRSKDVEEMPQACMPRIKLLSMGSSLALPLSKRQAEKLKAAQIKAGQERDVNADGVPETRLPWTVRPDIDFKIVNHKAWSAGVVVPVVRQVQEAMGFGEWEVEASLNEMLLCEEGCFYSEGRESDESPGVFATLMFQMPSAVEGGVFTVSDPSSMSSPASPLAGAASSSGNDASGRTVSFSGPGMYYVAFYTDCERELSQVTRGSLLTLVYNLRRVTTPRASAAATAAGGRSSRAAAASSSATTSTALSDEEMRAWAMEDAAFFSPGSAAGGGGASSSSSGNGGGGTGAPAPPPAPAGGSERSIGLAGIGGSPWANPERGLGAAETSEQALMARAKTEAARRNAAVIVDQPTAPQPASVEQVREIARAIRGWSAAIEAPSKLVLALSHHYPLDKGPPTNGAGMTGLRGRDRAVCNLLRLARETLARDLAARGAPPGVGRGGGSAKGAGAMEVDRDGRFPSTAAGAAVSERGGVAGSNPYSLSAAGLQGGGAGAGDDGAADLEVYLTRLVVSHGGENQGAFTTGPLIPLQPGDEPAQISLPPWVEERSAFRGVRRLPDETLPVDIASEVLHSGGPAVLSDLEGDYGDVFAKGPQAVEFLGKRVDQPWALNDAEGGAQPLTSSTGGGGGNAKTARFYSRAAIVCWPRSRRHAVQAEAQTVVKRLLARARQQLSILDEAPRRSAGAVRPITPAIVSLARQPQSWIEDEEETDVVFECLHRCEDPAMASRAVSAMCSALRQPDFSLHLPSRVNSRSSSSAATMSRDSAPRPQPPPPPPPAVATPFSSTTSLFSRVFSLLDGLDCWRLMSPQIQELIALNPSAFAGAVIARAAIGPPPPLPSLPSSGGTEGGQGAKFSAETNPRSTRSASGSGMGGGSTNPQISSVVAQGRHARNGATTSTSSCPSRGEPVGTRSFVAGAGEMPRLNDALDRGGSKGGGSTGAGGSVGDDSSAHSWREVAGETLARAIPEVASGRMRGARGCCAVADPASSSRTVISCDAACSPLPLMVRALQDVVGDLHAARMVRDAFSWIARGERELADSAEATVVERERRLDQLGSLVWSLGDLRRSLPMHDKEAGAASAGDGGKAAATEAEAATGASGRGGGRSGGGSESGDGRVSFMRMVVEQMEMHLVRVLDATASIPLPDCPFTSFKMDSGFACEHVGWRAAGEEGESGEPSGCVTCNEVLRPFLDNPYECWTSWVSWTGTDGEFSPAFFKRLGLKCSVEGDSVKTIVLTKPDGSIDIHNAMQPVRDALYLRNRAVNLLTSANTLAWLHFDAEEGGGDGGLNGDGNVGDRNGAGAGGGGGGGGGGAGGSDVTSPEEFVANGGGSAAGVGGDTGGPVGGSGSGSADITYADITSMDFDAVAAAAAEVGSEDWPNLHESNERRRLERSGSGSARGGARVRGISAEVDMSVLTTTGRPGDPSSHESHAAPSSTTTAAPHTPAAARPNPARGASAAETAAAAAAAQSCDAELESALLSDLHVCDDMDVAADADSARMSTEGLRESSAGSISNSSYVNTTETSAGNGASSSACVSMNGASAGHSSGPGGANSGRGVARRRFERTEGLLVEKRVWDERGEADTEEGSPKRKQPSPEADGSSETGIPAVASSGGAGDGGGDPGSARQHKYPRSGQSSPLPPSPPPTRLPQDAQDCRDHPNASSGEPIPSTAHKHGRGELGHATAAAQACGPRDRSHRPSLDAGMFQGTFPPLSNGQLLPEMPMSRGPKSPAEAAVEAVNAAVAASEDSTGLGAEETGSNCIQS